MQDQHAPKQFTTFLFAVSITWLLSACHSTAPRPESSGAARQAAQAERLSRDQHYTAAAQLYEKLALHSTPDGRNRQLLRAAREWLRSADINRGESLLQQIGGDLTVADRTLRSLVMAHAALLRKHPDQALAELDGMPQPLPRDDVPAALELRTQALFAIGQPAAAVVAALDRERLLSDPAEVMGNRRLIWDGLQRNSALNANMQVPSAASRQVAGWLELRRAALATSHDAFAAQTAIDAWRTLYPEHSANEFLEQEIIPQIRTATTFPSRIALLLPLSSQEQVAATEVRDGFIAALLQTNPERRPTLNVYDSHVDGAVAAYRRAIADGAEFVVGPLLKDDVAALIAAQQISIPTLALNYPADQTASAANLFQFWLDPTEEARQVAARVVDEGLLHGIALLPKNDWGERVYRAFETELRQRSGTMVGMYFYAPSGRDYTVPITTALLINESKARAASISAALHTALHFEPRRRSDVEFVFIGAEPMQGRMLRPALRFYLAETVPVFATSGIFKPNTAANTDLDGVMFPDMPWVISPDEVATQVRATINDYWPAHARESERLYAFGFDAYRLIPLLLSQSGSTPISQTIGMTGRLAIDSNGRVHRELDWARIDNGQLQPLGVIAVKNDGTISSARELPKQ